MQCIKSDAEYHGWGLFEIKRFGPGGCLGYSGVTPSMKSYSLFLVLDLTCNERCTTDYCPT